MKYNLDGTIAWAENVGGSEYDAYYSVISITDGYICVGYSSSTDAPWQNVGSAIIVKHNLDGTIAWATNTGSSEHRDAYNSVVAVDNGYIAVRSFL